MRKKILLSIAALLAVGAIAAYAMNRPEPADTRFSGAYALDDDTLVFITPREGNVLRYRMMNGESAALWPVGDGKYEGGTGWAEREPVVEPLPVRHGFGRRAERIRLAAGDGRSAPRARPEPARTDIHVPKRRAAFARQARAARRRGAVSRRRHRARLGKSYSAVDYYFEPYMYAANGFASLAFDKRGTGDSARQVSAELPRALRRRTSRLSAGCVEQPSIDGERIHLAGFSQGGWIAPLAALKDGNIRSVLVGYGVMVPVTGEDRWGYVYALQQKGFGDDAVPQADRINARDRGHSRSTPESLERAGQAASTRHGANRGSRQ